MRQEILPYWPGSIAAGLFLFFIPITLDLKQLNDKIIL